MTAAVAGLGTAAVKTTADFDTSMSQVQATMGITKDAMSELNGESVNTVEALRDLAKQMGSETAFSASECADAMNYLALAGYDTQEIYDTLPTVLNLAAAGGIDLASASDMVTDAMSALGMETSEADTMVDQMFCLVTKRGYLWFSGYKYTRDPRGFDILPDGTHGSSGFLTKREMEAFLEIGPIRSVSGMLLGKIKERPEDPDKYAAYEKGDLLPIEQRGLGDVYQILATMSVNELNRTLASLPPEHPAKGHHGLFLKARENLWGNIITGLGNRLAIFQNKLVDTITRNHDVDLVLPGQRPCAYFIIISAQDSAYRFLSSLFFSLAMPQLSNYARLHCKGGRLPVLVNFCLDEYCNISYMEGIADALNSVRGFNIACQVVVQSLSQWQQRYPGKEWENQLNTFNQTIYMGCNDLTSAKYISEKCGKVTIAVTNNQMPMQPLFSPIYNSTRPYSKTRSNIQRDLMQPDEVLRLDQQKCLALFQGHRPALLYKLTPEELPDFAGLTTCRVVDYIPAWKQKAQETPVAAPRKEETSPACKFRIMSTTCTEI